MPDQSDHMNSARRARELASALLASDDGYLDNVIEMWQVGERLVGQVWDTEFHVFGEIASGTDHLPAAKVRPLCSESMLENSDKELQETIEFYKRRLVAACNVILSKY